MNSNPLKNGLQSLSSLISKTWISGNRNNRPPKSITLPNTSNEWDSANHRDANDDTQVSAEPLFTHDPGQQSGGLAAPLKHLFSTRRRQNRSAQPGIQQTRNDLQHFELSINDLNARIERLRGITAKWKAVESADVKSR